MAKGNGSAAVATSKSKSRAQHLGQGAGAAAKAAAVRTAAGPALRFKPIAKLRLYDKNSRTHSEDQIEELKRSMREFGWTVPVLEDKQGVVAGHARIAAATAIYAEGGTIAFPDGKLIPAGHVPVLPCDGWSEEKRRAYIIVDNQLSLNAGWDYAVLSAEVEELKLADFDVALLGFPEDELHTIMSGWESDIDKSREQQKGEDYGINAVWKVVVKIADKQAAKEVIELALTAANLDFQVRE